MECKNERLNFQAIKMFENKELQLSKQTFLAILILIVTIFLWSSAFVVIRYASIDYSPGALALLRYLTASLVMGALFFTLKQRRRVTYKDLGFFFILGFTGFTLYNVFLNYGELTVSAGLASFIVGQSPLLIAILAAVFLKECIGSVAKIGFLISIAGLSLLAYGETRHGHFDIGILYLSICTVCSAVYAILQKSVLSRYHPIEIVTYAIWGGTLALLVYAHSMVADLQHAALLTTLSVIYMGIFPGALAYLGWCYGLSKLPASRAAAYPYLIPVFAVLLGWLLLGEVPPTLAFIGGCIMLMGAILINIKH